MTSWNPSIARRPVRSAYGPSGGPRHGSAGWVVRHREAVLGGWALFLFAAIVLGNLLGTALARDGQTVPSPLAEAGHALALARWCWSWFSG